MKIKRMALPIIVLSVLLLLSGCAFLPSFSSNLNWRNPFASGVHYLSDRSFQYNDETDDYSLFFSLLTKGNEEISAEATVAIRIVNDNGSTVYEGEKTVTKDDFGYYTSAHYGDHFLAEIKIDASEIAPGTTSSGTVYFTVSGNDFRFDESHVSVSYDLPILETVILAETLPQNLVLKGYDGKTQSKFTITGVTTEHGSKYSSAIKVIISGEKTYGKGSSTYDLIDYKLYDASGYMIKSGTVFLSSLSAGDKFRDDSVSLYGLTPGETYTIKFFSSN